MDSCEQARRDAESWLNSMVERQAKEASKPEKVVAAPREKGKPRRIKIRTKPVKETPYKAQKSRSQYRFDSSIAPYYTEKQAFKKQHCKFLKGVAKSEKRMLADEIAHDEAIAANKLADEQRAMDETRYSSNLADIARLNEMKNREIRANYAKQL